MLVRLSDLQHKDVINIIDGSKVGNIIDIKIDSNGNMEGLVVEKSKFFISMFSTKDELEIKWNQIEKIGEDVILVNVKL
ncbi:MAG: YlmC/YmxH family sporulation protein [Firmicutes bacterium]|nr:YlmC/YmxH family sporulation protein [Bacillota bacterium]